MLDVGAYARPYTSYLALATYPQATGHSQPAVSLHVPKKKGKNDGSLVAPAGASK
jgi:hypothetical protein